jgi:CubicO group peptidase (beta-lactamase class C family)
MPHTRRTLSSLPTRSRPYALGLCLATSLACSSPSRPAPATPVAQREAPETAAPAAPGLPENARVLEQDETVTLGGATFSAPAGWSLALHEPLATLVGPERDLQITFVALEGRSADEAIPAAWRLRDPRFDRESHHRTAPPPTDGWDEIVQLQYRTAPSESRQVIAVAWRKDSQCYVALIEGTLSGLARRGAQLQTTVQTLRAAGVGEESWAGRTPHRLEGERAAAFEQFIRTTMEQQGIPGVAVGVVQGGRLVFSRGFGVRALGTRAPVTPRTLFMIGSTTKPLTSLLMAKLVDERRFRWDTPVSELLPSFRLADADITQRMDIQHTVCACTGMPRRDLEFIFEFSNATPERWLQTLGTMAPTTGFGEVFQYSNLLVSAGGYAAARAVRREGDLRTALVRAMREKVFTPLGMRSTTLEIRDALRQEHADPHGRSLRYELTRLPLDVERGVESVGPAGAAWSNVEDMSRYLLLELRRGVLPGGARYISEDALLERRRTRVRMDEHRTYGLGLVVSDAHGIQGVGHGGNTLGFSSDMAFYPELDLGLVILTNGAGENAFLGSVHRRLLELLLDAREQAGTQFGFFRTDVERRLAESQRQLDATPARTWYASWLGTYRHADLGTLRLFERDGALWIDAGEWSSRVGRRHESGGEESLILLDPPLAGMTLHPPSEATPGLVLDYPQMPYRFEPEAGTSR